MNIEMSTVFLIWIYIMVGYGCAENFYDSLNRHASGYDWAMTIGVFLVAPIFFPANVARAIVHYIHDRTP